MLKKYGDGKASGVLSQVLARSEVGTLLPLGIMLIVIASFSNSFFTVGNLIDILRTTCYAFVIAAPLTLLLISAGTDLTIGAVTSLGGVVCAWGMTRLGWGIVPSILLAVGAGALCGVIKALIVVNANLPSFIVTLGLQYVINGFILVTTSGIAITGFPKEFKIIGQGRIFGSVFWIIPVAIAIGFATHILLSYTKLGRNVCAVGGNQETARLAGIHVNRTRFFIHVLVSASAALCGVFMASRFNSAQTASGTGTELTIMASVIIGGTSMFGGQGTIIGSFLGCLLLTVINNGLVLMYVSTYWQNLIFGAILVISLFIDKYRRSRSHGVL